MFATTIRKTILATAMTALLGASAHAGQLASSAMALKSKGKNNQKVDVIVVYDQKPGAAEEARLNGLGASVKRSYQALPMRALSVPAHVLDRVAAAQGVRFVSKDGTLSSQAYILNDTMLTPISIENGNSNLDTANVPYEQAAKLQSLNTVGVAVIDSGVTKHNDLNVVSSYNCLLSAFDGKYAKQNQCIDTAEMNTSSNALDSFGHGTHVAGIISGDGSTYYGAYRGVTDKLPIHSFQVLDGTGQGQVSDVIAALDWILVNGANTNIRVVNLSLGKGIEESNTTDPLVLAVEQVWDAGYVVVASAGNHGLHGNFTITSPGNSRKIITVGSLTDAGTGTDFRDRKSVV